MSSDAPQQDQNPTPPLFYTRPVPLHQDTHRRSKVRSEMDHTFASKANAIPLTVPEFVIAARHYPIIFIGDDLVPTAAVGLRPDDNLYVSVKGEWEQGQYIPAYVRRYPFILMGTPGDERLQLGIDEPGASSTKADARSLFDGETETDVIKQTMALCEQFHGAFQFTAEFSKALLDTKLTETRPLTVAAPDGGTQSLGNYVAVNEEKFRALPDETFLDWRNKGWLHAVFFHLQSMNNWEFLFARASARMAVASAIG